MQLIKKKSILREYAEYTMMNVIGMIGLSGYILADTFFISKGLGTAGLTSLNLALPVYSFVNGTGLLLGIGGAAKYSISKAQKADKETDQIFTNVIWLMLLFSAVFVLTGLGGAGHLASWLGADGGVYDMTKVYLSMLLFFSPAFITNQILVCFVRNDGNPRLSMLAMLTGSGSNIILDYIFIFPLGLGMFGAVLATGLAPIISICVLSGHWIRHKNHFHLVKVGLSAKIVKIVMALGVSSLISELASGIVLIVFNILILKQLGNVGVAAYGVIANLSLVITAIFTGIAQGMQPLTSRSYGHMDMKTAGKILRYAMYTMLVLSIILYGALYLWADPVTAVFNGERDMQMQEIAVHGMRLYFIAIPWMGFNILISMYWASIEKAFGAQCISLMRGFFVIIPVALVMSACLGMTGIWMAFPVAEIITVMTAGIFAFTAKRRSHT